MAKPHKPAGSDNVAFRAVEIRSKDSACVAARNCRGRRYLTKEAPRLPLADCDRVDRCECRYAHLPDRRHKSRRRTDLGVPTPPRPGEIEKRQRSGRRSEDLAEEDRRKAVEGNDSTEDTYYDYVNKKLTLEDP
jgi:hypothetical protein